MIWAIPNFLVFAPGGETNKSTNASKLVSKAEDD